MADFRIKYGLALGPYGSVGITSANTILTPGDTTPDVSSKSLVLTGNTSGTTITYFDGVLAGGVNGVEEGKIITLLFRDSLTKIQNAGQLHLASSSRTFLRNEVLTLIHHNSAWYEVSRSENSQNHMRRVLVAGSASINVDGVKTLLWASTAATTVVTSFSGGYVGQRLTMILDTAGVATRIANTAGNLVVSGTAWTTLRDRAAYEFVKNAGDQWTLINRDFA